MNTLYNIDLKKYGKIILKNHKEYTWLTWDEEVVFRKEMSQIANKPLVYKKSVFDINNDGSDETVLYRRGYRNWKLLVKYDNLLYAKDGYKVNYDEDTRLKLNKAKKLVNLYTSSPYNLKKLPHKVINKSLVYYNQMNMAYIIKPFLLDSKYYISLFGNIGLEINQEITWQENSTNDIKIKNGILIAKYDKNNILHDICYFIRPQVKNINIKE